jgi:integrase
MRVLLTDRFCQHAKSAQPQTDYFDENVSGLALRVTKLGTKAWTFHYTSGKRRRLTLGRYPALSLAAARTAATEAGTAIAEGRDPRAPGVMTVAVLSEAYIRSIQARGLRSAGEIERRVRKDILPIIGNVAIEVLHRRDVTRVLDAKSAQPIAARRAFEDLRAMVRWAVSRGDLDHSPLDGMKGPAISKIRERVLSEEEIRTLWLALPMALPKAQQIIKLCLVTGQRIGEVCGLQRSELDLAKGLWSLPGARTKNGHPHTVPLSGLAIEIIEEALTHTPASAQSVFALSAPRVAESIKAAQSRIRLAQWTAHDLRRTALTQMAALGIPPIVRGHVANHRTTTRAGVTLGVYDQYSYDKEKREALALWADRLRGIIDGVASVVPLRSKR